MVLVDKRELDREIGRRIRTAREAAGMTQARFGELVGMGSKNVSAVERGQVGISVPMLLGICEVLKVSPNDLLLDKTSGNDVQLLCGRLERLSAEQFRIALDVNNSLLEAFALSGYDEDGGSV